MDAKIRQLEKFAEMYEPPEAKKQREEEHKGREPQDEFQRLQFELADQIRDVREKIKARDDEEAANPGQPQAVRLAQEVRMGLSAAQETLDKLRAEDARMGQKNADQLAKAEKKKKEVPPEVRKGIEEQTAARKEILENCEAHIEECTKLEKKRACGTAAFGVKESHLTEGVEAPKELPDIDDPRFQKLREQDAIIDQKLGQLSGNLKVMKNVALELRSGLEEQGQLMDVMDEDIDHASKNLKETTGQVEALTKKVRDKRDMCCIVLVLIVLIVAVVLLIINVVKNKMF